MQPKRPNYWHYCAENGGWVAGKIEVVEGKTSEILMDLSEEAMNHRNQKEQLLGKR